MDRGDAPALATMANAPSVEFAFHWWAFEQLTTERSIGMGTGPIPYSAITAFMDEHNIKGNSASAFVHIMRALDNHYLKLTNARQEKAAKLSK